MKLVSKICAWSWIQIICYSILSRFIFYYRIVTKWVLKVIKNVFQWLWGRLRQEDHQFKSLLGKFREDPVSNKNAWGCSSVAEHPRFLPQYTPVKMYRKIRTVTLAWGDWKRPLFLDKIYMLYTYKWDFAQIGLALLLKKLDVVGHMKMLLLLELLQEKK